MSRPHAYEWQDYLLLVTVTCPGPRTYGFLSHQLSQEEVIERISEVLSPAGHLIVGITISDLTPESYSLMAESTKPLYILE